MTNNDMLINLIRQSNLGMIEWDDEELIALERFLSSGKGDGHAEYQGDKSRWVDLTPEQVQKARENMWTE